MTEGYVAFSQSIPVSGMFPDNLILSIFNTYYTITHLATDFIHCMRGLYTILNDTWRGQMLCANFQPVL